MVLLSFQVLTRSLACRLGPCHHPGAQWVRQQSTQPQDDTVANKEEPPTESASQANILAPLDEENLPDVHVDARGEVYDAERLARDVSRMYPHNRIRMSHVNAMPQQMFEHQKSKLYQRQIYARIGRASGIDPGVMWPSREEIGWMTKAEVDLGIPTLEESWSRVRARRGAVEQASRERYAMVEANMAKMEGEIKAFRKRQRQAEEAVLAEKAKREKVMEEAKELLGFKVDPRDKRFQELMDAKEAAAKKEAKQAKKKAREEHLIARLSAVDET